MTPGEFWRLLRRAGARWQKDNAPRLGAALAFYATFSLAPLLLVTVAIAARVLGPEAAEGRLLAHLQGVAGNEVGAALQATIAAANEPAATARAALVGAAMTLVGAAWLFGELRDALNTIWEVEPRSDAGVLPFVRRHLLTFAMVLGTAIVLLASLAASAALTALGSRAAGDWRPSELAEAIHWIVSLSVTTVLFAMIFRFLPDVKIGWRDVWIGAGVTSLLFSVGKVLISLYLVRSAAASAFGVAGTFAALLIWLYYSAQIFLFGAELTREFALWRSTSSTKPLHAYRSQT